jgi:hypothetical protein
MERTARRLSPVLANLDEVGQCRGPHDMFIEAIETAQGLMPTRYLSRFLRKLPRMLTS